MFDENAETRLLRAHTTSFWLFYVPLHRQPWNHLLRLQRATDLLVSFASENLYHVHVAGFGILGRGHAKGTKLFVED